MLEELPAERPQNRLGSPVREHAMGRERGATVVLCASSDTESEFDSVATPFLLGSERTYTGVLAAGAVLGALTAALFDWTEDENAGTLGGRIRHALGQLRTMDVVSDTPR